MPLLAHSRPTHRTQSVMRALVKTRPGLGLSLAEQPQPEVGPDDLLIAIERTAICGTDVHIYNWDAWSQRRINAPLILGHEFVGVVAELGERVTTFCVGDRVSGEGHVTCGVCRNCRAGQRHLCRDAQGIGVDRSGCFAEYLTLPAANAFKVPSSIPDNIAACLDPLGNAAHAALSFDLVGEDVVITGAGPIGLMAVAIARRVGARNVVVTDVNPYRLAIASALGASRTVDVRSERLEDVRNELGLIDGFRVGLEMSGDAQALRQLLSNVGHGGHIALLGIPSKETVLPLDQVIFKGLVLKGIYGREIFETWHKVAALLDGGLDVSPIVTHSFKASDYQTAFTVAQSGCAGKVTIDWTSH